MFEASWMTILLSSVCKRVFFACVEDSGTSMLFVAVRRSLNEIGGI